MQVNKGRDINGKSLKLNMLLNAIKGVMSVLFPLITFPYASRVLGVENIGKYNFSNSVVSYIVLVAGLGIAAYARREGSAVRNNKMQLELFSSEMFSMNIITTIISYLILVIVMAVSVHLQKYAALIWILSLTVILQTIGVEWIYSVFEDYLYITLRSILFQLLSLILLFCFVKQSSDLIVYSFITVVSCAGANIMNFIHIQSRCRIRFTFKINWKKHLPPILIFFATTLSVTIYVSSDITILGFLCGDYNVGLYSVSTKIYTLVKGILASVIVVSIPRLCALEGQGYKDQFIETAHDIFQTIITITLPALIGVCLYTNEIIYAIAGAEYYEANISLVLLAVALICYMFSYFWGQCILVPLHKEKIALFSAVISAMINIILNLIFIPTYKQNAAAFTTIVGEGVAMLIGMWYGRRLIKMKSTKMVTVKTLIGCFYIVMVAVFIKNTITSTFLRLICGVLISVVGYFAIEILLKNESIYGIVERAKKKIIRRRQ